MYYPDEMKARVSIAPRLSLVEKSSDSGLHPGERIESPMS